MRWGSGLAHCSGRWNGAAGSGRECLPLGAQDVQTAFKEGSLKLCVRTGKPEMLSVYLRHSGLGSLRTEAVKNEKKVKNLTLRDAKGEVPRSPELMQVPRVRRTVTGRGRLGILRVCGE